MQDRRPIHSKGARTKEIWMR